MAPTRHARLAVGAELLFNFVLPYLIYVGAQPAVGRVHALLAASLPPIIWSLIQFARTRRIDVLSIVVLAGIALSLLAFLGGGSVRFLELREHLVAGLIGLAFLGSVLLGRPLMYELSRAFMKRSSPEDTDKLERLRDKAPFRRAMTVLTVVWGVELIGQTAIAGVLVFRLSIRECLVVAPIISYSLVSALALSTLWYAGRMRRRARRGIVGGNVGND